MRDQAILKAAWIALAFFAASSARGDEATVLKYKNYSPEQIKNLPPHVRDKALPVMYTMAAQRGLARDGQLAMAMDLNVLMYPGVQDFAGAVRKFQIDLGEKPTGTLTVWQIHTLQVRAAFQRVSTVGFPDFHASNFQAAYASVQGTLEIIDDRVAWPINHVNVFCSRTEAYCEKRMITLSVPREDAFVQMYGVYQHSTDVYKITRWDTAKGNVDAVPNDFDDTGCRSTTLSYNFKTKEFLEITRDTGRECEFVKLEKLSKPRIARIVNGRKIIDAEFAAIAKKAYGFLATDFRKAVDAVSKPPPPKTQPQ